jgi:hypothetical protein
MTKAKAWMVVVIGLFVLLGGTIVVAQKVDTVLAEVKSVLGGQQKIQVDVTALPQPPDPALSFVPDDEALTATLIHTTERKAKISLTVLIKSNSSKPIVPRFGLFIRDTNGCTATLKPASKLAAIESKTQVYLTLLFAYNLPDGRPECQPTYKGAWTGRLSLADEKNPDDELSGLAVTVTATQNPRLDAPSMLSWLRSGIVTGNESEQEYLGLHPLGVLSLGFIIPLGLGLFAFCWLFIRMRLGKIKTEDGHPVTPMNWVVGNAGWNPSVSLVSTFTTVIAGVNILNIVPTLDDSGKGLTYLTTTQHTFIGVTYATLWLIGLGVYAITSVRAKPSIDVAASEDPPNSANRAWVLAARDALTVAGAGQLLLVFVLILEAYRNFVLPAVSTYFLMGLLVLLLMFFVVYGISHARKEIEEFVFKEDLVDDVLVYTVEADPPKPTCCCKETCKPVKPETPKEPQLKQDDPPAQGASGSAQTNQEPKPVRKIPSSKIRFNM